MPGFRPPFTKIVLLLTFSDVFSWGIYASISAIVGIYLANKLDGNAIEYIGIGTGVYMLVRSILQLPIGFLTDRIKRDRDELTLLMASNILMGIPFLLYPMITTPYLYFGLQFIFGIGTAINLVCWRKLFARNLDRNREGEEYALYETIMSLAIAVFSIVTGVISNISEYYFELVITTIGLVIITSSIFPFLLHRTTKRKSNHI